jgi:hypothetical protein
MKYLSILLLLILGAFILFSCGSGGGSETTKNDTSGVLKSDSTAAASTSSIRFAAWLEGAFGNRKLQFFMEANNSEVTGKYRYLPNKKFLNLKGIINSNKTIQLTETNDDGTITGNFTGVLNKSNDVFMVLKWTAPAGSNNFSVELSPVWMQYEEDSVIATGKYNLGLKMRRITESTLGYSFDEVLKEKDVRNSIEKEGVYAELPSSSHGYVTDQYVEFISSGMSTPEAMQKLNHGLNCTPLIEKVLDFKIPSASDLKFSEEGSVGKMFSVSYFSYYEQNLISMNSYYTTMMAGAAHPSDGFMLACYNLDTGMKMEAGDLFDLSKKQEINNLFRKKMEDDCVAAVQQFNGGDSTTSKDDSMICIDITSKDNDFNVTEDKVSLQLNACGFPYMARYCATLELDKVKLKQYMK